MSRHKSVILVLSIIFSSLQLCSGEAVLGDICKYGILNNGHRYPLNHLNLIFNFNHSNIMTSVIRKILVDNGNPDIQ